NQEAYLLDAQLQPVPLGVPGEICITGIGFSRGYLGRPDLTAERFVPLPWGWPGTRLYRTGDRGRLLPGGVLEFLGRLDHQVKVRGQRVELGEVEVALAAHPGVRQAVVVARDRGPGDRRLVAYFVSAPAAPGVAELRDFLVERLPAHMIPAAFVALAALPLSPNGKVDRKALPEPDWISSLPQRQRVPPRTPLERGLAAIWAEVLGVEEVGAHDNFFELGGHSLLATRISSRVRDAFGVELPLRTLFESPTVAGVAAWVEQALAQGRGPAAPPLEPVPRTGPLPVSFAQQRLWFIDRFQPGGSTHNVLTALRIRGALSVDVLARAFTGLVRRHETL